VQVVVDTRVEEDRMEKVAFRPREGKRCTHELRLLITNPSQRLSRPKLLWDHHVSV